MNIVDSWNHKIHLMNHQGHLMNHQGRGNNNKINDEDDDSLPGLVMRTDEFPLTIDRDHVGLKSEHLVPVLHVVVVVAGLPLGNEVEHASHAVLLTPNPQLVGRHRERGAADAHVKVNFKRMEGGVREAQEVLLIRWGPHVNHTSS